MKQHVYLITKDGFVAGAPGPQFNMTYTWDIRNAHTFVDIAHVRNMAKFLDIKVYTIVEAFSVDTSAEG